MIAMAAEAQGRRLAALADRLELGRDAARQLGVLLEVLVSDPLAPTAVRDPAKVIDDHLADSLVALELERVASARRIADIGSGAGLPALPLAIGLPQAEVEAIDSSARKTVFIARAIARCEIVNARAVTARAEDWREGLGRFDLVTARALAPLGVLAEYAAPLLELGGVLVAWRGRRDPAGEDAAGAAAALLGLEVGEVRAVRPYAGAEHRHLHVLVKVGETPPRFPRRAGMARKRPLVPPAPSDRLQR